MSLKAFQMCAYLAWQKTILQTGGPKIKTFLTLYMFDASYKALAFTRRFCDYFLTSNSSLHTVTNVQ